ncbi:LuxR family transcriptional regulator [Rhodovulum sp. 12E13]|uniref:helix-turn-helix transcriptional regulator n=1 Tax=Rhodovulum sp. 12E13 TaxID=2203891 RepID=UPI000E163E30|nr:helix-turn-helix transcriptional regulator [Rhodovulum sp. 12E13]RDC73817.1 LuxR family transcriptional regulator [Rhodovulum sp. 12E13]
MTLHLTDTDIAALAAQQTALLTERLDDAARVERILSRLSALVKAERAFAAYMLGPAMRFVRIGVGPQIEAYLAEVFEGFDRAGNVLMRDRELEEINRRRRQMGAGVHHEHRINERRRIERARYFREAFAPAGMHHVIGLTCPLPLGEAVFAFGFHGDEAPGFRDPRSVGLLRLMLPAFQQGFERAFARAESEAALSNAVAKWPGSRIETEPPANGAAAAAFPGPALPGADRSWIVLDGGPAIDPARIARTAELYGLTERQTEVMMLMLEGLSSAQIADRLGISRHTARRHAEAVLARLNLRSRAAIWSVLA